MPIDENKLNDFKERDNTNQHIIKIDELQVHDDFNYL
jgi:hypothetical protein